MHLGPFSVAVAFWLFIAVAAVAGIIADYKKRQLALEPLRAAIERGQQLDLSLVERLMAPDPHEAGLNPLYLRVGGVITVSAGVGVAILSFFLTQIEPIAFYPVLGGGLVVICVGVGLVVAARVAERYAERKGTNGPGA